jgi:hypothetical protein
LRSILDEFSRSESTICIICMQNLPYVSYVCRYSKTRDPRRKNERQRERERARERDREREGGRDGISSYPMYHAYAESTICITCMQNLPYVSYVCRIYHMYHMYAEYIMCVYAYMVYLRIISMYIPYMQPPRSQTYPTPQEPSRDRAWKLTNPKT